MYVKKLLFLLLILTSCSKPLFVSQMLQQSNTRIISFEKYSNQGFLFSYSPTYYGNYESKGMITCELFPQYNFEKDENRFIKSEVIVKSDYIVDIYTAFDSLQKSAVKMGANAIIELKIEQITKTYTMPQDLNDRFVIREFRYPDEIIPYEIIMKHPGDYSLFDEIQILGVKVYGFAIKRF